MEIWHSASRTDRRWHVGRHGVRVGLNRRGSALAAEIDPRLGAGQGPSGQELRFGQSGTPGITGRMSLEEIIAAADCVQRHAAQVAIAVSGIRARSAAGCGLRAAGRRFVSTRFNTMQIDAEYGA